MLEELLNHIRNRFPVKVLAGAFEVSGGTLAPDGVQDGQFFWVDGSVFNDGLHRHPDVGMRDESFAGKVTLMAVPQAVIDLADEIGAWREANEAALSSPYQSESFGGYSYAKDSDAASWQAHFRSRLNPYRKLA